MASSRTQGSDMPCQTRGDPRLGGFDEDRTPHGHRVELQQGIHQLDHISRILLIRES